MEPYYNESYGQGLEGITNYANSYVDNTLGIVFIGVLYIIMLYNLSKSEWKFSASLAFTSIVCLLISWIFSLFITFSVKFLYLQAVVVAISVVWSIIDRQSN